MDQHPEEEVRRRRWPVTRAGRSAAVGGLAAALLAGGIGIAAAQSDSPTTTTTPPTSNATPQTPPPGGPIGGPGRDFGPHGGFGGPMGAVHGEFVQHFGSGYRTIDVQTGQVTSVNSSSITVKSDDGSANGFTKTYSVDENTLVNSGRDGIRSVHNGDTVSVEAVVNGNTANAMHIDDRTTNSAIRQHWAPPGSTNPSSTPGTPNA